MQVLRSEPRKADLEVQPSGDGELAASRLDPFPSEVDVVTAMSPFHAERNVVEAGTSRRWPLLAGLATVVLVVAATVLWMRAAAGTGTGALRVETDTPGADITVDGSYRGKSPLLLSLAAGNHTVRVEQGTLNRTMPVAIAERTTLVHHISWPATQAAPVTTGGIEITSDPRGQAVSVDGQLRGVTPLVVSGLAAGQHEVVVRKDATSVRRTVVVEGGANASLMISTGAAGVSSGWVSISVSIPLQIYEADKLVGSSESDRILVPVGTHNYELVNENLGFRVARTVQVVAGQTTSVSITLPRGTINVNAVPWAQVWLDGQPLGETPIGNVSWTIGTHELILRHPDLGERRVTTTITTRDPARVAVDMRKTQ